MTVEMMLAKSGSGRTPSIERVEVHPARQLVLMVVVVEHVDAGPRRELLVDAGAVAHVLIELKSPSR